MSLIEKIEADLKEAMKSGDTNTRDTLRLLLASLKNLRIQKRTDLTDSDVLAQLGKEKKTRQESIEQYAQAGRKDLADKEESEITVIEKYLPEQLSAEEIEKIVDEAISNQGAQSVADMGRVMSEVMAKTAGQADGSLVSQIVKKKLGNG